MSQQANAHPMPSSRVTIIVCETCRDSTGSDIYPRPGDVLGECVRDALASRPDKAPEIGLKKVACLGNCTRRLSAALVLDGGWSYVFGALTLDSGPDLVAGAELFLTAADGLLPWRGRPASLKKGMVARLPPLDKLLPISSPSAKDET